jgi:hypothetical protein
MNDMMLQATLLTRASRLSEATALIQRTLRGESDLGMTIGPTDDIAPTQVSHLSLTQRRTTMKKLIIRT